MPFWPVSTQFVAGSVDASVAKWSLHSIESPFAIVLVYGGVVLIAAQSAAHVAGGFSVGQTAAAIAQYPSQVAPHVPPPLGPA